MALLLGALGLMAGASCKTDDIMGRASVIDGDTIELRGQRVRLHGIDAPEAGQSCSKVDGTPWPCGQQAALALSDFLGTRSVQCVTIGTSYDRLVAVCEVDGVDVSAWLAREGWAIASVRYSHAYVDEEQAAKQAKRHIWQGVFVNPREWRFELRP